MKSPAECKILVVDDDATNVDIMVETLGGIYDLRAATDGLSALEAVEADRPDLILLDIMMPRMGGYEVRRRLKADARFRDIPVIFVTALGEEEDETQGLELGAVDYIVKPISPAILKARVNNHLRLTLTREELSRRKEILELRVRERARELALTQEATIYALATMAETRDPETGGHIRRTQNYVLALAEYIRTWPEYRDQLDSETINLIYKSAPLHDVGKVGVPDVILLKPGKLTTAEFEVMKKHTTCGRETLINAEERLGSNSFLRFARQIAYTHHEKWDGTGYPEGIKGEDIPLAGRLMAVADVYDAIISKRVYKPPFPHPEAVSALRKARGTHFDPRLIDAFLDLKDEFRRIALKHTDFEEELRALRQEY